MQYHDIKSDVLNEIGEETTNTNTISYEAALNRAIDYLKEYSPSYLHHYAKPLEKQTLEDERGIYHFTFPRVVDGIVVNGDQISVSLHKDGTLYGLNVNFLNAESWPASDDIITESDAKAKFIEALTLKLEYLRKHGEGTHYDLVFTPYYHEESYNLLNAGTGEWLNQENEDTPQISHPWAKEELNYLASAKILKIDDAKTFKADKAITKGEAIEVIMKSLTYIHDGYPPNEEAPEQSFENIGPEHPYYQVIERAVSLGVLDTEEQTFDTDSTLTREELAVWYVRALELEIAAKHSNIYLLGFKDAKQVLDAYKGHVALSSSLGLLSPYQNRFNPKKEVSYAELAVSTIRLAHKVYEKEKYRY